MKSFRSQLRIILAIATIAFGVRAADNDLLGNYREFVEQDAKAALHSHLLAFAEGTNALYEGYIKLEQGGEAGEPVQTLYLGAHAALVGTGTKRYFGARLYQGDNPTESFFQITRNGEGLRAVVRVIDNGFADIDGFDSDPHHLVFGLNAPALSFPNGGSLDSVPEQIQFRGVLTRANHSIRVSARVYQISPKSVSFGDIKNSVKSKYSLFPSVDDNDPLVVFRSLIENGGLIETENSATATIPRDLFFSHQVEVSCDGVVEEVQCQVSVKNYLTFQIDKNDLSRSQVRTDIKSVKATCECGIVF